MSQRSASPLGGIRCLHGSVMFLHHGLADAKPQPSSTAGALRRVERIKDARQVFFRDAGPVVMKTDPDGLVTFSQANPQCAAIAGLADRLLSVHNQVQEYLH